MSKYIKHILFNLALAASIFVEAQGLNCPQEANPVVCNFLKRYIKEITTWEDHEISLQQKLRDDKFIILEGSLDNLSQINDSTKFLLVRFDDKGYEASWYSGNSVLLDVAFPIQYELLIGLPQHKLELLMPDFIAQAPQREHFNASLLELDSLQPNIYVTSESKYYELKELNNKQYLYKNFLGQLTYVADTTYSTYTISNLFQGCLDLNYTLSVLQQVYGLKSINYETSLDKWLNYCYAEELTIYVAIEEEREHSIVVLVVAENKDLGYNHIMSIDVPKDFLVNKNAELKAKLTAFIPTHNIKNLYEQYIDKERKEISW